MTIAVDASFADSNNDHDLNIGISDGKYFIGMHIPDDYGAQFRPCWLIEGNSNTALLTNRHLTNGSTVTSKHYSTEIKIQLKLAEKWGSCYTSHNGGYVNANDYQLLLDPSKGLFLEVYHSNSWEKYRIRYIVVDVNMD